MERVPLPWIKRKIKGPQKRGLFDNEGNWPEVLAPPDEDVAAIINFDAVQADALTELTLGSILEVILGQFAFWPIFLLFYTQ